MNMYDHDRSKRLAAYSDSSPDISPWHKFGTGIMSTTLSTIWAAEAVSALYTYPTGVALYIASESTDDDVGGAGCESVEVIGLDTSYAPLSTTVAMNGTTKVLVPGTWGRVFRLKNVSDSGQDVTGPINVGTGTFTSGVPAIIHGEMRTGNQSQMAFYTVPTGKTLLLESFNISVPSTKIFTGGLYERSYGGTFRNQGEISASETNFTIEYKTPRPFPEKTDIEWRGLVTVSGGSVSVIASGLLVSTSIL